MPNLRRQKMQPKAAYTREELVAEKERRKGLMQSAPKSNYTREELLAEKERRKSLKAPETKPQEEGMLDYAKRALARGTRNAAVGALDTADFLATPVRAAYNAVAPLIGTRQAPALGEEVAKGVDTLTGGYTAPRNDQERTSEAIGRALGSLPSGLGIGTALQGLKYAPKAIEGLSKFLRGSNVINPSRQGLTNIATTGATSGMIQQSLNENPENVVGALGSGIAAGYGIPAVSGALSLLTGKGRQGAAARIGEGFKVNPKAVETFEQAGVTPTLADVSQGKIAKMLTNKLEHTPFAAEPIREAKELQRNQILEGLGQGEFGKKLSKTESGKLTTKGARKFQKSEGEKFSKMKEKVDKDIHHISEKGDDNISFEDVDNYFNKEIFSKFKDKSQTKLFKESPEGQLYEEFHEAAKKNGGTLPYYAAHDWLKAIRNKISSHGTIGDETQGRLKQFANHLGNDIDRKLSPQFKRLGKEEFDNWKEFRKNYREYKEDKVPKLNEIYKKDKKSGTDAFIDLMTSQKKGGEKPSIVLKGLSPEEQIDLTDAVHKHLGRNKDGSFSPLKWSREFKGLEPESQKVLLSPLNESSKKRLNYIADSMDHLKSTLEEANTSKSGYYVALDKILHAIPTAATALAATGNVLPAATLAGGLFVSRIASDKLLTNPKFINWMYKGMKAKDLAHFERNLNRVPHVGKNTKALSRSIQTFQHDLNEAGKEEKGVEKKKILHFTPQKNGKPIAEMK